MPTETKMKFRIVRYYERYRVQVCQQRHNGVYLYDDWINIGSSNGYPDVHSAKQYCKAYKDSLFEKIVEEFEL